MAGVAKARYAKLDGDRGVVLERARESSDLTIPGLIPRAGLSDSYQLLTPYQSLGARGVNNLASKLLLALLPPNTAFFRLSMDEDVAMKLGGNKEAVDDALAKMERKVTRRIETSNARAILFEILKLLIVSGNALMYADKERSRVFRLDQYVVVRDAVGHPLEVLICEKLAPQALPVEVKVAVGLSNADDAMAETTGNRTDDGNAEVELYTHIKWDMTAKTVDYYQECNGVEIPGSRGSHPLDRTPWAPLRWQPFANSDYGRGLVDEYAGDLRSLEGISMGIVQFAAVASKIVFLLHPNATTDSTDLTEAESGDVITGSKVDVDVLQLEKQMDFNVAKAVADELTLRLSNAFLLRGGAVRDAERVTAEEIRGMAQELEDVLGGVYTVLAQELQLPFIKRVMAQMTKDRELPALPKGTVEPMITTGFEALGRNHAANKLRAWLVDCAQTLGPQVVQMYVKADIVMTAFGKNYGVENLDEMIHTEAEVQQMQQAQQQQEMMQKAAPGVAQEATKGIVKHATGGAPAQPAAQQ
jgi:Bacteriophage head to tail connecting protein